MTKTTLEQNDGNKQHKTLRDKLKKRRQQLKKHKKQKKIKKQEYDAIAKKAQFFEKKYHNSEHDHEVKQKKIIKYIKKFIDIYEDDLEQFFSIFEVFDKQGEIDIADMENKQLQKCLKKMFKYLPLSKHKLKYQKKSNSKLNLNTYIMNKVSQVIVKYMENGSDDDNQSIHSSSDQNMQKPIKTKKQPKIAMPKKQQSQQQIPILKNTKIVASVGPFISAEDRLRIAQIFSEQVKEKPNDNDQFNRIFQMSSQRQKKKKVTKVEEVPAHLMAQGSAKLGQKVQIDSDYLQKYNNEFRPKKLIDLHREMMQQGTVIQSKNKQRKAFDRQRDVVNGGNSNNLMNNGMFFDFKDRMTKPKNTNNFL